MIDRIETNQQFEALAAEWNSLLEASKSDCFFLTWEWLSSWWKHLAARKKLHVLRVRSDNEVLAFVPLTIDGPRLSTLGCRTLSFLGSGFAGSDYLDFIIRRGHESRVLRELADYLAAQNCMLNLSQLHLQSAAADLVSIWKQRGGLHCEIRNQLCPVIRLSGHSWDSYLGSLSSSHRYNFRRRLRQLSSKYEIRFERVADETDRAASLARLITLHNARRESLGGSDAFHTAELCAFHQTVSRIALQRGWLRLFTLWLNDQAVAALYGFFYQGVFYFYQCGFDPRFLNASVGLVTMGLAIQSAIEEGAHEYDMLHGAERYKFHWAGELRELTRLELYPLGSRGALWKAARQGLRTLKGAVRDTFCPSEDDKEAVLAAVRGERATYAPDAS